MSESIVWHRLDEPEGRGWPRSEMERRYDRLPAHARESVPSEVWALSRHSSSLYSSFRTDATAIHARWNLGSGDPVAANMTAIASNGLDLYGVEKGEKLRWVGCAAPTPTLTSEAACASDLDGTFREYRVYFPLFNELLDVEIGVTPGSRFELVETETAAPVVYYGTSIVHGIAASRPGMSLPAILGRRLRRPVIGLGFSGHGRMERSLGELIGEIDAAAYVVDCLPNMDRDLVMERTLAFTEALRARRLRTPIVFVEDRTWGNAWITPARQEAHDGSRIALRAALDHHRKSGDDAVHLVGHDHLLGNDGEATVDGSHPTDLGLHRMADKLEGMLSEIVDRP